MGPNNINEMFLFHNKEYDLRGFWVSTRFHISNRPLPFHLHLHEISKFLDPET